MTSRATTAATVLPAEPLDPADRGTILPSASLASVVPVTPIETIIAIEPVNVAAASADTVRPRPRLAEPPEDVRNPEPKRAPDSGSADTGAGSPPEASRGAAETERRCVADGVAEGVSENAGARKSAAEEAGNAAASNYPGTVKRKINRPRKPRVGAQGTAIVGFDIGPDVSLASATILRSSGESAIDQAALDHLRRAAPFQAPPAGAQRRFQLEYVSRGQSRFCFPRAFRRDPALLLSNLPEAGSLNPCVQRKPACRVQPDRQNRA